MLRRLRNAYWSDEAPTVATGVLAVGTSLLFCIGLVLIFHARANSQADQLRQAVSKIQEGATNLKALNVEGDSSFKGDVSAEQAVDVGGELNVEGDASFAGSLVSDSLETIGDAKIGGALDVQSATTIENKLNVVGAVTIQDTLDVNGKVTIQDSLNLVGEMAITGGLQANGSATLTDLDVSGRSTFRRTLDVGGEASIGGAMQVFGAANLAELLVDGTTGLKSTLTVSGNTTLEGDLTVGNGVPGTPQPATVLQDALTVEGSTLLRGVLDVAGFASFKDDVEVFGQTQLQGDLIVGTSVVGAAQPTVELNGALDVVGATEFNSTLEVYGAVLFRSTLEVDGATTLEALTVTSATTFDGGLTVNDVATFNSTITVSGAATFTDDLTVCTVGIPCTATISGSLTVGDPSNPTDATFNGGLVVAGGASLTGDFSVEGATNINGTVSIAGYGEFGDVTIAHVVNGQAGFSGNLVVDGITTFKDGVLGEVSIGAAAFGAWQYENPPLSTGALAYRAGVSWLTTPGYTGDMGDAAGNCGAGKHIRITEIRAGLVSLASCALDSSGATNYDLAEKFPSNQTLEAGEVVSIDPSNAEYVVRSAGANDKLAIGVISTAPGYTLGEGGPGYPVALAGRVPVKVTAEGGAIAPGDYLTSSSTPGHAKKAGPGDKSIGQALAAFSGSTGTVIMFVNTAGGTLPAQEFVQGTQSPTQGGSAQFADLNVSGHTKLATLEVTGLATIKDLTVTGATTVADLTINGHIIGNDDTRGAVVIKQGETKATRTFTKAYQKQPVVVASPISQAVPYKVMPSKEGFELIITAPAAEDLTFNFLVQE